MNKREQAARHVLGYDSMDWAMGSLLALPTLDWFQIENLYPALSSGEQVLVRLASHLAGRESIAGLPTVEIPRGMADKIDDRALRRATEAIAMAPSEAGAW